MFALLRRNRQLNLPLDIQLELFDSLVLPILTYGCEVWGFKNTNLIEKLHLKYLKYSLSLKMSTQLAWSLVKLEDFKFQYILIIVLYPFGAELFELLIKLNYHLLCIILCTHITDSTLYNLNG